jgi:hypothetical protein
MSFADDDLSVSTGSDDDDNLLNGEIPPLPKRVTYV